MCELPCGPTHCQKLSNPAISLTQIASGVMTFDAQIQSIESLTLALFF